MGYYYFPDYNNCIANIPNSVMKYFGAETVGKSLLALDKHLNREYKNVVLLVLDGMGITILNDLDHEGLLRKHQTDKIDSVFLTSTVPATTALMTGLQPCERAWLGQLL